MKLGSWVMTKSKRIGVVAWVDKSIEGNMYLLFPVGISRSHKQSSLTLFDPPLQKLLTNTYKEFYEEFHRDFIRRRRDYKPNEEEV